MALAGRTNAEIIDGNKAAFEKGELTALEPGAQSYRMSKQAYLTDDGDRNSAHLTFYAVRWLACRFAEITGDAEFTI